jgi:CheY-like chemotaxis protein
MSQAETNHDAFETRSTVRNGRLNSEASPPVSSGDSAIGGAAQKDDPVLDAVRICSQFLAKLSHQMRTPLSSISGVNQLMLEAGISDSQAEYAETVAESVQSLTLLADSIVEFSGYLSARRSRATPPPIELKGKESTNTEHAVSASLKGANAVGHPARSGDDERALSTGVAAENRRATFHAAPDFSTRVPPATAKLIRVLVAEDHLMNQHVMLRMLARLGYSADAVCNGVEAVAALARSPYDIVLMDCQMPELDGYEATRQIRQSGPRFRSTPIIAVTANAMDGDREKCLAAGMSDYITKPVLAHVLATILEKWIMPDTGADLMLQASAPSAPIPCPPQPPAQPPTAAPPPALAENAEGAKMAAAETAEPVDPVALANLRAMDAGDEGFLLQIIELFLSDLTERLVAMRAATEVRDGAALKRIAHALKGSCGHFGAVRLAALCRKMEQVGTQQPVTGAAETFQELAAEAGRVRLALETAKHLSHPRPLMMEESG